MKKMTYRDAVRRCLTEGWFDYVSRDGVFGNGFQIAGYGLKLIAIYIIQFLIRLVIAVLFPLSAILLMKVDTRIARRNEELEAELDRKLDLELGVARKSSDTPR